MIVIIDYGAGNVASIRNMLRKAGFSATISGNPQDVLRAAKLILPGVGHFDHGMQVLHERGLVRALEQRVQHDGIPILGICLGAQLFARGSEEGTRKGLGWLSADVRRFDTKRLSTDLRIPHMGWAEVTTTRAHPLLQDLPEQPRFYFVHSYHLHCDDPSDELIQAVHGYPFTAGVAHRNLWGVQFHPEKSHRYGLKLLENFARDS